MMSPSLLQEIGQSAAMGKLTDGPVLKTNIREIFKDEYIFSPFEDIIYDLEF